MALAAISSFFRKLVKKKTDAQKYADDMAKSDALEVEQILAEERRREAQRQQQLDRQAAADRKAAQEIQIQDLHSLGYSTINFECPICLEPQTSGVRLYCGHHLCVACLKQMAKASDKVFPKCWKCRKVIHVTIIRRFVGKDAANRMNDSMVHKTVLKAGGKQCNTPDCKGMGFIIKDQKDYKCTVCHKLNCVACEVVHEGMTCKAYQDCKLLNAQNAATAEFFKVAAGTYKKCPKCGHWSSKISGCTHVTCLNPSCTVKWCFDSGKLRTPET